MEVLLFVLVIILCVNIVSLLVFLFFSNLANYISSMYLDVQNNNFGNCEHLFFYLTENSRRNSETLLAERDSKIRTISRIVRFYLFKYNDKSEVAF